MNRKEKYRLYYLQYRKQKPCPVCGKLILITSQGCQKHRPYPKGEQSKNWKGGIKAAQERFQISHPFYCIDCGRRISNYQTRCQKCSLKCFGPKNWKGGRIIQKGGYIKILKHDHPAADQHGYIWEHRFNWEQTNNKLLPSGWVIHHLNGIRNDNRPINLVALPSKKHSLVLQAKAKRIQELEALLNGQKQLL